jgi:hypothetical protein
VPRDDYPYVVKHNPFSSFAGVVSSQTRWERIVGDPQLWIDVKAGELPEYAWLTPDMWNDGHYVRGTTKEPPQRAPELVDQAAQWLEWFFATLRFPGPELLLPPRTLVVVTFDESDFEAGWEVRERFSIAGVMTAKLPVSYNATDETTTSDGYGTLAEAGGSEPLTIPGVRHEATGAIALAGRGDELLLLCQPRRGARVLMTPGRYARDG